MITVRVPGDASARSVGADAVAAAFASAGLPVIRTGSRGALWLEPLVELSEDGAPRVGVGPVTASEVPGLLALANTGRVSEHPAHVGPLDELGWLTRQTRVTFARVGVIDPVDPDDYEAHGGMAGLRTALSLEPAAIVERVIDSGLRGRGGAGFPTGIKWRTVAEARDNGPAYVVVNADEGDSGTFADRMLLEGDPLSLLEGMTIAGLATGARQGFIYVRSEYPDAIRVLLQAIDVARERGWLGRDILDSGATFDVAVRVGAGSYVCGEETALLNSLEGRRGTVRAKPPIPALAGLFGRPTVVNNVLTIATVPAILADRQPRYGELGVGRSTGTSVFQLAGNVARGGIVEVPFGVTVRELVHDWGGGTRSGRPVRAVQVGGPLGAYLPADGLDVVAAYEPMADVGAMLGHGGIVVFDDTVDMAEQAQFALEFCAEESCGVCTPCRIGSVRGAELVARIRTGVDPQAGVDLLTDLCEVMRDGSLCAMGGLTPMPVLSALRHFPEDFGLTDGEVTT